MLIKRKKLQSISKVHGISLVPTTEVSRAGQVEIQKAKQEAKTIKQEAEKALLDAQQKLKEAELKANEIIQTANQEAKKIKEKVYNETLNVANKESEIIKSRSKELLKELFEVKRSALLQAHNEIVKVAFDLSEKILRYKASIDPEILKTQVIDAIKKATSEAERIKVFVNPVDLNNLENSLPEIEKLFPSGLDIVLLTGDSIDPGSCIVETKSGQLDSRFSAQINALKELINHIEVKEPDIVVDEKIEIEKELQEEPQSELRELLSNEPLIEMPEEEQGTFSFPGKEEVQELAPGDLIVEETSEQAPSRKRLTLDPDFIERTKEEARELDEDILEEIDETDIEEEIEEPPPAKSVLKPKKTSSEVSNIAQELEESPEWKDLIEGEEG